MAWWNNGSALANSLVAYWKLDESSGSRADSVGANTLTDNNTVTANVGRVYATAAEFLAANSESLSIADNTALSMQDIQMFFGGWIYLSSKATLQMAFGKTDTALNQRAYFVQYDSATDRISAGFNALGTGSSTLATANSLGSPALNTWYFVLGWHDSVANTINISVNGREPDSVAYSAGIFDNPCPFRIGASSTTAASFWSGRIGPVFVGKGYIPTAQNRLDMLKEAPSVTLDHWWLGNAQIAASNVLEHVEIPDIGQLYAGSAIAPGQPWTVAVKSYSYLASANLARYLFDSESGRFTAGINTSSAYGFYNGSAWTNAAIFAAAQEQIWYFVSNDLTIQAYLNNVAVGVASASSVGLDGLVRWAAAYNNGGSFWNNPILYGAVYDKALDALERRGLTKALQSLNTDSDTFTASGSFVAPAGVTMVTAQVWGGGGGGNGNPSTNADPGGGGGGGGFASGNVAVVPGNTYTATVGAGAGSAGTGGTSTFTGDSGQTVIAGGGTPGASAGGNGGVGSGTAATVTHTGGHGGAKGGTASGLGGAGGGAGAGTLNNGAAGVAGPNGVSNGSAGGSGANGGGSGGAGGTGSSSGNGVAGSVSGGGGGGCGGGVLNRSGGVGARGQINITWVYPAPAVEVAPSQAASLATTVAPTIEKGSVLATAVPVLGVATTQDPTVLQGSVLLSPAPALAGVESAGEAVQGSVSLAPAATAAYSATATPQVAVGANPLTPVVTATVGQVAGPTVIRGSVVIVPAVASAFSRTIGGSVSGSGATLNLDPANAVGRTTAPVVVKGSLTLPSVPAQALAGQVNPTVVQGGMVISPLPTAVTASSLPPILIKGGVLLELLPAFASTEVAGQALVAGVSGLVAEPAPVGVVGTTVGPTQAVVGLFDSASKQMFVGVFKGFH